MNDVRYKLREVPDDESLCCSCIFNNLNHRTGEHSMDKCGLGMRKAECYESRRRPMYMQYVLTHVITGEVLDPIEIRRAMK